MKKKNIQLLSLLLLLLLCFFTLVTFAQEKSITITSIEVDSDYHTSSFTISFDEPLQRIESSKIPVKISPQVDCHWAWIDHKNLNCSLNDYTNVNTNRKLSHSTG